MTKILSRKSQKHQSVVLNSLSRIRKEIHNNPIPYNKMANYPTEKYEREPKSKLLVPTYYKYSLVQHMILSYYKMVLIILL